MKKIDPFESNSKPAPSTMGLDINKKFENKVRVKFNFSLLNPSYDHGQALRKAKEEKSIIAYNVQKTIDFSMNDSVYKAGEIYEVSEEFFNKWSQRRVETYNSLFGAYQGEALKLIQRPKIPYVIKVDDEGKATEFEVIKDNLDLYPVKH